MKFVNVKDVVNKPHVGNINVILHEHLNMLRDKIKTDFLLAYKSRETTRAGALRTLEASLKQVEIDTRKQLTDEDVVKILRSELKKRDEAIALYKQGNRQDLADKEIYEAELIKTYLPAQMPAEEIAKIVDQAIAELGAEANFGQIMQKAMALTAGKADGKMVSEAVRGKLSK